MSKENFKIGDVIVFTQDVKSRVYGQIKVLIEKDKPVRIMSINKHHLRVLLGNTELYIRNIPSRMKKASKTATLIYGD